MCTQIRGEFVPVNNLESTLTLIRPAVGHVPVTVRQDTTASSAMERSTVPRPATPAPISTVATSPAARVEHVPAILDTFHPATTGETAIGVNCGDYSSCSGGTCTCNSGFISSSNNGRNCYRPDPCAGINCGDFSSCSGGNCNCNPDYLSPTKNGRGCFMTTSRVTTSTKAPGG